jgi:hypothetical protein
MQAVQDATSNEVTDPVATNYLVLTGDKLPALWNTVFWRLPGTEKFE